MFACSGKTIETERLLLRPFTQDDAENVAALCNNFNVYKSVLSLPYPYTVECALSWIARHEENFDGERMFEFAIADKHTGALYGCIGLSNVKAHKHGEMGYWIGEEYWGNGYATEAAKALIRFAFEAKGYHRVHACHFASNPASGKVMEKAGMTCEGMQKQHVFKLDTYQDIVLYGIVNPAKSASD